MNNVVNHPAWNLTFKQDIVARALETYLKPFGIDRERAKTFVSGCDYLSVVYSEIQKLEHICFDLLDAKCNIQEEYIYNKQLKNLLALIEGKIS